MLVNLKRRLPALAAAVALGVLALPALAADGKTLFADKGCTACHGEDARTSLQEGYPRLAGQNADYVVAQLKDMKSGARANGLSVETMKPILEDLGEPEFRLLADYLASLAVPPAAPASAAPLEGAALYRTKTCIACHGKEGRKPMMKTYPALAGQEKGYILRQMIDIKTKARANGNSNAMQAVMHLVDDAEIAAIAEYLSQVK